jgi:hypothetical protein
MILQFFTKTRPTLDVPFFEDSEEGKTRADAIIQLALDNPELVILREADPIPAIGLTWSGMWKYAGWEEFKRFMQLSYDADTELRADRAKYIVRNGQEMLIETQQEGATERVVQVHITPQAITRYDNATINISQ